MIWTEMESETWSKQLYRFQEVRWREITKLQHYLKPVRTVQV